MYPRGRLYFNSRGVDPPHGVLCDRDENTPTADYWRHNGQPSRKLADMPGKIIQWLARLPQSRAIGESIRGPNPLQMEPGPLSLALLSLSPP